MVKTQWSVKVPRESTLAVKEKELVKKGQVLVRVAEDGEVKNYDLSVVFSKFSVKSLDEIKSGLTGRIVEEGEELLAGSGWFPKKILAPVSGEIIGVNEFYNLSIKIGGKKGREILSPVEAMVAKIDKEKIVLEFNSEEFKGQGLFGGKVWGEITGIIVNTLADLSYRLKDKIILVSQPETAIMIKAEVVGVAGIVVKAEQVSAKFAKMNFNLPVLAVDNKNWELLADKLTKGGQKNALLNTAMDRLLVIIDKKHEKN